MATYPNCGKLLIALDTIFIEKSIKRPRLIAVNNGNKSKDWIIRSQTTKSVLLWICGRFRD